VISPPPKPEVILTNFFAEPTVLLVPITSRAFDRVYQRTISRSMRVRVSLDFDILIESFISLCITETVGAIFREYKPWIVLLITQ
jgi:hypothetical protein